MATNCGRGGEKTLEISGKKFVCIVVAVAAAFMLVGGLFMYSMTTINIVASANLGLGAANSGVPTLEVHTTVDVYDGSGKLVSHTYHAGYFTYQGMNMTLCKWAGNNTLYNALGGNSTTYLYNITYVSLGYNSSGFTQTETVLPWEWTRDEVSQINGSTTSRTINFTGSITPPAGGPYSGNLIGLNCETTANATDLIAYDVWGPVTGIDATFTITYNFGLILS
jgi:hypothetical protein